MSDANTERPSGAWTMPEPREPERPPAGDVGALEQQLPDVGWIESASATRTTVVLPEPLDPSRAITECGRIANDTPNSDRNGP